MYSVSIILPTYNREKFLSDALAAIKSQLFEDWELIIVDDGSTDGTRELVCALTSDFQQPVRYIYQENQGAYGARNTGLDHARGKYMAFYDSDDLWLPHHLAECVEALESNPDVDWVYSASCVVENSTGVTRNDNCFYGPNGPRAFLSLRTDIRGSLRIIRDPDALLVAVKDALYAGLQGSVIRKSLFHTHRLPPFRVGEDQVFSIASLAGGATLAYFDSVHFHYRIHDQSVTGLGSADREDRIRSALELAKAFESVPLVANLSSREHLAWRHRVNEIYFWQVGYPLTQLGQYRLARRWFRYASKYRRFAPGQWKTHLVSYIKERVNNHVDGASVSGFGS